MPPTRPSGRASGVKRGKLHPEQGQIGGRNPVRATGAGERCAAQPSGRPHEPSGDRRTRRMAIPSARFGAAGDRTRLTDRLADVVPLARASAGLVLVGAEDVRRDAGVADGRCGLEVAQGDRHLAVREQALHVVDPLGPGLDVDQAAKRAALDAVRRQVIGVGLGRDDREGQSHDGGVQPRSGVRRVSPLDSGGRD